MKALGWVPAHATRDGTYEHLNGRVPKHIKHELHVLLVAYGKVQKNCVKALNAARRQDGATREGVKQEGATQEGVKQERVKQEGAGAVRCVD